MVQLRPALRALYGAKANQEIWPEHDIPGFQSWSTKENDPNLPQHIPWNWGCRVGLGKHAWMEPVYLYAWLAPYYILGLRERSHWQLDCRFYRSSCFGPWNGWTATGNTQPRYEHGIPKESDARFQKSSEHTLKPQKPTWGAMFWVAPQDYVMMLWLFSLATSVLVTIHIGEIWNDKQPMCYACLTDHKMVFYLRTGFAYVFFLMACHELPPVTINTAPCPFACLRISVRKLGFTPRNLNLDGDRKKHFPELGSMFKGHHVKVILWYLTVKSIEFADKAGVAGFKASSVFCTCCVEYPCKFKYGFHASKLDHVQ